jgi:hypothetical protein
MASVKENVELESFLVTKHSAWKGKYKRILTIGSQGIATYNPDKFDATNRWPYSDIISVAPNKTGNVGCCYLQFDDVLQFLFGFAFRIPMSSSSH